MQTSNTNTFDLDVLKSNLPTFVLFTTPSAPKSYSLEILLGKLDLSKYKITKVDVESNYELNARYSIRVIPSIWLFINGSYITQKGLSGILTEKDIEDMVPNGQ